MREPQLMLLLSTIEDIYQNDNSGGRFPFGLVLAGLTLRQSGPSNATSQPPSIYNGDRVVQLRFKYYLSANVSNLCYFGACYNGTTPTSGLDLGIIQVRISDYFGLNPGSGYKILSWRTPW